MRVPSLTEEIRAAGDFHLSDSNMKHQQLLVPGYKEETI